MISSFNTNFGQIQSINSYRVEVNAYLVATLFLHLYFKYNFVHINQKCMCSIITKCMLIN